MMNERNYTKASKSRRNRSNMKRVTVLCFTTVFIIFAACAVFGNLIISAHGDRTEEPVNFKYYKSIEIQKGDTLWDIAEAYITEDYQSVAEYVADLKEMNSLKSDSIEAGQYLMIAYNDTEF